MTSSEGERFHPTIDSSKEWWKNRTRLEQWLIIGLGVGVLVAIIVIITYSMLSVVIKVFYYRDCTKQECVVAAAQVSGSLDRSVKPCDNFYDFACGGWMKDNVATKVKPFINAFPKLTESVRDMLKRLFEAKVLAGDLECVRKLKSFYKTCMDKDAMKGGLALFKEKVDKELGGWPLTGSDDMDKWQLEDNLATMKYLSHVPLFKVYVDKDFINPTQHKIHIDRPIMPNLITSSTVKKHMKKLIETCAYAFNNSIKMSDIDDIVNFKERLSKIIQISSFSSRAETRKEFTVSVLQNRYPHVKWIKLMKTIMGKISENILANELIVAVSPGYFDGLDALIGDYGIRTLQNFMVWEFMEINAWQLSPELESSYQLFYRNVYDTDIPPRYEYCIRDTVKNMRLVAGRMFVDLAFDKTLKKPALEIVEGLHSIFKELLLEQKWIDTFTLKDAKEKVNAMILKVGYPSAIFDDKELNIEYKKYTYDKKSHIKNVFLNSFLSSRWNLVKLRLKADRTTDWHLLPTDTHAENVMNTNAVNVPAGVLQPPFFTKFFPKSMNYGSIGYIIGSEISRGFGSIGQNYDKYGAWKQWWSKNVRSKFTSKSQCFIDQYDTFSDPETRQKVNGNFTLEANIADIGGLKISFKAYKKWLKKSKRDLKLPGLKYSDEQMFFISFAQTWCASQTPKYAKEYIKTHPQSPPRFRVIGALQNSEEFSKVFKCSKKSYMNPPNKCGFW